MTQKELAEKIRSGLEEVNSENSKAQNQRLVQSIVRTLNLIDGGTESRLFKKFGSDLMQLYSGEQAFEKLNTGSPGFSPDGFFRSFNVLRQEIIKALENLDN